MSQIVNRRCSNDECRQPLVSIDHGKPYPFASATVICLSPLTILCTVCRQITTWETVRTR